MQHNGDRRGFELARKVRNGRFQTGADAAYSARISVLNHEYGGFETRSYDFSPDTPDHLVSLPFLKREKSWL